MPGKVIFTVILYWNARKEGADIGIFWTASTSTVSVLSGRLESLIQFRRSVMLDKKLGTLCLFLILFLYVFLAGYSVLATLLLMSPILYIWVMSGFELRELLWQAGVLPTLLLLSHPSPREIGILHLSSSGLFLEYYSQNFLTILPLAWENP